jgi:hypothetical protein
MKRHRVIVLAVVVAMLASTGTASADPIGSATLVAILNWLYKAEVTVNHIKGVMGDIEHKVEKVYPLSALRKIERTFNQVRSVEDELRAMSCNWGFTPRVQRVWDGLFRGVHLCKPEFQRMFGGPAVGVDADLQEYYDASSVVRLNAISTRLSQDTKQAEFLSWLAHEAQQAGDPANDGKYSVGYSERLTAQGTAALGALAVQEGDTRALDLQLRDEMWQAERYEERMNRTFADFVLQTTAGRRPGQTEARR